MDIFWYRKGAVQQVHHTHLKNNLHKIFHEHDKVWVDMPSFGKEEEELLRVFFNIHPLTIEDIAKSTNRPKIEEFDTYIYIVLYGLNEHGHFSQMNFLIGQDYIVTICKHKLDAFEALKKSTEEIRELLARDTEFVMYYIVDQEVNKYYPLMDHFDETISKIEDRVITDTGTAVVKEIFNLKHQLITLKHHIGPQKEIIYQLSKKGNKFIRPSCTDYFRDVYDHVVHAIDNIDNYREILNGTLEVHLSVTSNHLNDIIKYLTVFSTIFMPLTFIASIYGMNFENMPELGWKYGYFVILGIMAIVGFSLFNYFKKRRWV
jgi:magnesium transporter